MQGEDQNREGAPGFNPFPNASVADAANLLFVQQISRSRPPPGSKGASPFNSRPATHGDGVKLTKP